MAKPVAVCIIDEIGKMETLFSKKFNAMVQKILDNPNVVVVGTVAMQGGGFIGEVRHRKGSFSRSRLSFTRPSPSPFPFVLYSPCFLSLRRLTEPNLFFFLSFLSSFLLYFFLFSDVEIIEVTHATRNELPEKLIHEIQSCFTATQ